MRPASSLLSYKCILVVQALSGRLSGELKLYSISSDVLFMQGLLEARFGKSGAVPMLRVGGSSHGVALAGCALW